jgi:hypothetical protein
MDHVNTQSGIDYIIFEQVKESISTNKNIETSFQTNENYKSACLKDNKIIYNIDTNIEKENAIRVRIKHLLEK